MDYNSKKVRGWKVALAYFDLLGKPLTTREFRRYVWMDDMSWEDLSKEARQFRQQIGNEVFYSKRSISAIEMEANHLREEEYWRWVRRYSWVFGLVPFLRLVMVMNGLAHGWVNERSDIDIFSVTRSNRLWTARFGMIFILTVLGLRARGERKSKLFSPEFFVDEENMDLQGVGSSSKYLNAYWVSDFTPIAFGGKFLGFWSRNKWLNRYLPVAYRSPKVGLNKVKGSFLLTRGWEWLLSGWLGDKIELWLGRWQKTMIANNIKRLGINVDATVSNHVLKLHFNSQRPRMVEEAVARIFE